MERFAVYQPYFDQITKSNQNIFMWGNPTAPKPEEIDYLKQAGLKRHLNPQPGSRAEFGDSIKVTKERAIKIGAMPVVYFRKTIETIDLLANTETSVSQ